LSEIVVSRACPLNGKIGVSGAKNSALPILAATLLVQEGCVLEHVAPLYDVTNMCELLSYLGCRVDRRGDTACIDATTLSRTDAPYELVSRLRASFLVMGPLLARYGYSCISLPGGCAIGSRPVDLHLKGFSAMGATITQEHGCIQASAERLHGAKIYLDFPSVGATQNLMMAATLAEGETVLENAATEPEVSDLAAFLCRAGAIIEGAGTDTLHIFGVEELHGCRHEIIPDRIEAGTFMVAAAMTHGRICLTGVNPAHLKPVSAKLREIGVKIHEGEDIIEIDASEEFRASDIKTMPFPGFPTDMQAQFMSLLCISEGTGIITETIFENRFMHVPALVRMNANIRIEGRVAVVEGVKTLTGARLHATDLRAGAALVLAGLAAQGETVIADAEHIYRGYDRFEEKLCALGAPVRRG